MKLTNEEIDERIKDKQFIRLGEYVNNKTPLKFQCKVDPDHVWEARTNNILSLGQGCPHCKHKGEMRVGQLIREHVNFGYFKHHKEFRENKRRYVVDFFLEIGNRKVVIERNGEQHYMPVEFFGGEEAFKAQTQRDKEVRDMCKKRGYLLIEIPYTWSEVEIINSLRELNDIG